MTQSVISHSRPARLLRGLAALIALAALTAGLPAALWHYVGWPLPDSVPTWSELRGFLTGPGIGDRVVVDALACLVWLLWALLMLSLAIEAPAALRGYTGPRLPALSPLQVLAATLLGAVVLAAGRAPVPANAASRPAAATAHGGHATASTAPPVTDTMTSPTAPSPATTTNFQKPRTYTVQTGDTLWDIAGGQLGDPTRWVEIYDLNRDTVDDPDLIYPGWRLRLPPASTETRPPPRRERPHPPTASSSDSGSAPTATPHAPADQEPPSSPDGTPATHETPDDEEQREHGTPVSIELPSGGFIGITLVAAIGAAITLARLHRQRRRTPSRTPGAAPADPPLHPSLQPIRRAYLHTTASDSASHLKPGSGSMPPGEYSPGGVPPEAGDSIPVGADTQREIHLDLPVLDGLGLTGPGAGDTARALLATLAATGTHGRMQAVIPQLELERLLTESATDPRLQQVEELVVTPTLEAALTRVEAEIIHRTRLHDADEPPSIDQLRRDHPDEPLPTVILLTTPPPDTVEQLTHVLAHGAPLGIGAVLLEDWPSGHTCRLDSDGTVLHANNQEFAHLVGHRLFGVPPSDLAGLLAELAGAHAAPEPVPDEDDTDEPAEGHRPPEADTPPEESSPASSPAPDGEARARPVSLSVLGPLRLAAAGSDITTGIRRKGYELAAYLAAHPDGATLDTLTGALWPDEPPDKAASHLHDAVKSLRRVLRHTTGAGQAMFVQHTHGRYQLAAHLIDVDLWHFRHALAEARHAATDEDQLAALHRAAEVYQGGFCADEAYEWGEDIHETLRRDAADALTLIAELDEDRPEHALAALERAIIHDPYNEGLYRNIMQLQAQLGRTDAVRRTYELLQNRLAQLDVKPEAATARLAAALQEKSPPAAGP